MSGQLKDRINVSLQAVAQVLVVCGLGVYLARKHGLDRKAIAAVSGVNWHVLIPALMFSSIVGAVTPSNLALLWPMLLVSLMHIVLGVVPALVLGWLAKLPRDMWFFAVMASSLPNCGNLPWLFMPSIIKYYAPPAQAAAQTQYMVGLVSVYTIITILVTLTVPFIFKRPPDSLLLPRRRQQQQQQGELADTLQVPLQDTSSVQLEVAEAGTAAAAVGGKQVQSRQLHHLAADGTAAAAVVAEDTASHQDAGMQRTQLPHAAAKADQQLASNGTHHQLHEQQQQHANAATAAAAGLLPVASHSTIADSFSPFELAEADEDEAGLDGPPVAAYRRQQQQQAQLQAAESFASHRSSSRLLQHGQFLVGSFSRSFGRSFSRGLRRSESMVKLVWTYPLGWQRDRTAAAAAAAVRSSQQQQQQQSHHQQGNEQQGASCWQQSAVPRWLAVPLRWCRAVLDHPAVNVPLGATVLGIACAAVGPVWGLLVDDLAPLHWLWLSLSWVGAAAAPLATMQIGAELMQAAPVELAMHVTRRAQWLATAIAIAVKLLLVPLMNVALIRTAGMHSLVPAEDKVYQLLLLVEAAVPAAVTLLVVCGRVYPDIRPLSQMLFWQYVASLVTLPAFLVWFMYMLDL